MEGISNLIYFDNNATTRLDERVADAMQQAATADAKELIQNSRQQIAGFINCAPDELFFTDGVTSAIHLTLQILFNAYQHKGRHVITSCIEHGATLQACEHLKQQGATITYLDVNREGLIDPDQLAAALRPDTAFVSIMAANNHTGVIQPVESIAALCRQHDVHFFSDASQLVGKMRCDVAELGMDSLVFGGHKMHGPKGVGVIYARRDTVLHQQLHQQPDLISFNDPIVLAGLAKAAELCETGHWENSSHISRIKNYFEHQLLDIEGLQINGSTRYRLYNTSNLTFPAHKKIALLSDRFKFLSYGPGDPQSLKAMGLTDEEIGRSFRFSFGKFNTLDEVKQLTEAILQL